jgi:intein/homing endonuclease
MNRLTVYERLKPEIKEALHSSKNDEYKASIDSIVEALSNTTFYSDLKISDVSSLYTFSNLELIKVSAWDFKYGDNILISKDYE